MFGVDAGIIIFKCTVFYNGFYNFLTPDAPMSSDGSKMLPDAPKMAYYTAWITQPALRRQDYTAGITLPGLLSQDYTALITQSG